MVRVSSGDDPKNGIIISLGILEPLENDGPDSICSAVAARPIIKCVAIAYGYSQQLIQGNRCQLNKLHTCCGQKVTSVKSSKIVGICQYICTPSNRSIAVSPPKIAARGLDCSEA